MTPSFTLLDEQRGSLRERIGHLLSTARSADFALTRVRLATLDLRPREVNGPTRCRVLLERLDAATLGDIPPAPSPSPGRPGRESGPDADPGAPAIERLARRLDSGRLQVRSAGIRAWTPDFSVFDLRDGSATALVGAHYFGSPQLTVGPSFTMVVRDIVSTRVLAERFEEEWREAHDVAPAIRDVLYRVAGRGSS